MEDALSEVSSIHYVKIKAPLLPKNVYNRIGNEEGLFELSNCNHNLEFDNIETKLPSFEEAIRAENYISIKEFEEEGVKFTNTKSADDKVSDPHFDIKSTTSSQLRSIMNKKNVRSGSFHQPHISNKNYERVSLRSLHTISTGANSRLPKNSEDKDSNFMSSCFELNLQEHEDSGNLNHNTLPDIEISFNPDKEEDKVSRSEANKQSKNGESQTNIRKVFEFLQIIEQRFSLSSTLVIDTTVEEFIEKLLTQFKGTGMDKLKNIFDLVLFIIHSYLLTSNHSSAGGGATKELEKEIICQDQKSTDSGTSFLNLLTKLFFNIFDSCLSIGSDKGSRSNRKDNLRKRCKTFFHKNFIKILNCLLIIILHNQINDNFGGRLIRNIGFNDPHIKNNVSLINLPALDIISMDKKNGEIITKTVYKLLEDENLIESLLSKPLERLISQVFTSLLFKSYEECYTEFYSSLLYKVVLLENIIDSHGKVFATEFDSFATQFILYTKR